MNAEWLNQPDFLAELSQKPSSIITTIHSKEATLVPADFFEVGCEEFVCETTFGKSKLENYFLSEFNSELNLHTVFQMPEKLFDLLIELFPTAKISHQITANLTAAKVIAPQNKLNYTAVFCENNYLHIVAFKNNSLYFSNQFEIQTATDCLYFTLATVENLQLQDAPIVGFNVGVHPNYWETLQKYHQNCVVFNNSQLFDFSSTQTAKSTHFLNLLCA